MARGVWGVDVRSLDTGERLFELNAGKLMMPASNMKILTLAAAAETLGWDYRFTTTLETRGADRERRPARRSHRPRQRRSDDQHARGTRRRRCFDEWAAALEAAGIQPIDGRIVGDDSAFDDEGLGAGWSWDYLQYGYAAPVGALRVQREHRRR